MHFHLGPKWQIQFSSLSNVKKTPRICVAVGFQCANLVSFCSFYKTKHILETEERLSRISDTFLLSSGGHSTVDFETDEKKMKNSGSDSLFLSCCSSLSVSLRVSQGKWCFSHSMIVKWPPRKKRDGLYQGAKSCHFFEDKILFLKAMSFPNTGCFILKGKNSIDGIS